MLKQELVSSRAEAIRHGWLNKDPEWKIRIIEGGDNTFLSYGPGLEFDEHDLSPILFSLEEVETNGNTISGNNVSLFEQTRKILDHMWCAEDLLQINGSQESDWRFFKKEMRAAWSTPLLHTMLLFAAMVNCRIPLSAACWVNRLFVPVCVGYSKELTTVGLIARHARQPKVDRDQGRQMYSIGQHLSSRETLGTNFGKDHFLVDPNTKVPVGILPDFLPDERTNEHFIKATTALYDGFCDIWEDSKVRIMTAPLSTLEKAPSS